MSFDGFAPGAETALGEAVLNVLRADLNVQAHLGDPTRVIDGDSRAAAFPFVQLERHEVREGDALCRARQEHRLQLAVVSRTDWAADVQALMGAMRAALEGADWPAVMPDDQRVVSVLVTYSDVMRNRRRTAFRGVQRIKILTEQVDAE